MIEYAFKPGKQVARPVKFDFSSIKKTRKIDEIEFVFRFSANCLNTPEEFQLMGSQSHDILKLGGIKFSRNLFDVFFGANNKDALLIGFVHKSPEHDYLTAYHYLNRKKKIVYQESTKWYPEKKYKAYFKRIGNGKWQSTIHDKSRIAWTHVFEDVNEGNYISFLPPYHGGDFEALHLKTLYLKYKINPPHD